jgi:hypothetical protein
MNHYFGKMNYYIMIAGCVLLALGFFLMIGKEDIYGTTKTVIAPILLVIGFAINGYAIMYRNNTDK